VDVPGSGGLKAIRTGVAPGEGVAEGVGRIPGFVNSYTYSDEEETYLIDTGFSSKAKPIIRAFQAANVPISRVRKLLLTHHHIDHMGGAAYLLEVARAPVACHGEDAPFVDGRTPAPIPLLMRLFVRMHPAPVATVLKDGDRVGSLQVLHAPGHTPGEVVFYNPARKILFSGDAVVERKGRLTLPAPRFAANLPQAVRTLGLLRALDVEVLLPGHGLPITKNVGPLLDDLIQRAPDEFLRRVRR
jgi:glyoxylase-like metal-dependent hydrolase (beta-lactamase superfamily II)